jgi:hypothetical protein
MDWFSLSGLNWQAIVAATIASFVVGYVWYRPRLFGRERGEQIRLSANADNGLGGSFRRHLAAGVVIVVTAALMNALMVGLDIGTAIGGACFGLVMGAVFRLGAHLIHHGFALRGHRRTMVDGVHDMVSLAVVGAIIGAFI